MPGLTFDSLPFGLGPFGGLLTPAPHDRTLTVPASTRDDQIPADADRLKEVAP